MNRFLKLFTIIFIYIWVFCTISYAGFEDISGHWCEKEILSFQESNIVEGYDDGNFKPDSNITRAELCKIINSYMNYEVSGEWKVANMEMAKKEGYLISGTPDETITREEAFVVLHRAMKLENIDFEITYIDSGDISIWALPAVKTLTFMEYANGYATNEIRPNQNMTRAEVIKILYCFVGIGGVDEDIEDVEFTIGYLSHNKYGVEFVEVKDILEIESGENIILAATVSDDVEVKFEIVSGDEFVELDDTDLRLEAIESGRVEIIATYLNEKKSMILNIK